MSVREATEDPAISSYVEALRSSLSVRGAVADELIEEIRDHLLDAIEAQTDGLVPVRAVEELGHALSQEAHRRAVANAASRSRYIAVAGLVAAAAVTRSTVAVDRHTGISTVDRYAIATSIIGAVISGALGIFAHRRGTRLSVSDVSLRRVGASCIASGCFVLVAFAAVIGLGGDLVADSVTGASVASKIVTGVLGIVLVAVVGGGLVPIGRSWSPSLDGRRRARPSETSPDFHPQIEE